MQRPLPRLTYSSGTSSSKHQELTPLSASAYFAQALEVSPPSSDTAFRVYLSPPTFTAKGKGKETVLVCHHGAGASALSFATLAKDVLAKSQGELGVVSYDCRGHGEFIPFPVGMVQPD
jgi:protein phosphatase methylesterase 1